MDLMAPQIALYRYPPGRQRPENYQSWTDDPAPIAITRADFSRSHGITPNAIMLDLVPLDIRNLNYGTRQGNLVLRYDGATLTVPDCVIDAATINMDESGTVYSFSILDRRWRWQYGSISGHYNRRTETGKLIDNEDPEFAENYVLHTLKSPQQLAQLLLLAMGENAARIDVSALPAGTGPEMLWEVANPARELASLVEMFGCRIVYCLDDKVRIYKLGQAWDDVGQERRWANREERAAERRVQRLARLSGVPTNPPLPNPLPVIRYSESVDIVESPRHIEIFTSPTLYQWDFELEAVGLDKDGVVKLLKDLSYAPNKAKDDGGFTGDVGSFSPIHGANLGAEDEELNELAKKSVCRWYRVKMPVSMPFEDVGHITELARFKPLVQYRATTVVEDSLIVAEDALVYGQYYDGAQNNVVKLVPMPERVDDFIDKDQNEKGTKLLIPDTFSIDTRHAMVKFRSPICRLRTIGDTEYFWPADLRLRCAFYIRDRFTGGKIRKSHFRTAKPELSGITQLHLLRDDITPIEIATFTGGEFKDVLITTNEETWKALADEHYDAVMETFYPRRPSEVVLAGFYPQIDVDGVIRNVGYSFDSESNIAPITTTLEIDQDVPGLGQLSYIELRQHERVVQMRDRVRVFGPRTPQEVRALGGSPDGVVVP
jgi:hypothetical protein